MVIPLRLLLAEAIDSRDPATPVVLTSSQDAAYQRVRDRFVAMWHDYSAIDRWLY